MKSMNPLILVLALSAVAGSAAATPLDLALDAAVEKAREAVAAARAQAPASCEDAKELETPLELTVTYPDGSLPLRLRFEYAGCGWEPRNDYLPPYTTRSYRAEDGYGLTIVTDDGRDVSEVLLSKGKAWAGNFGGLSNAAIVSGDPVRVQLTDHEDYKMKAGVAELRNAAKPAYPELKACEAADWSLASGVGAPVRDASGAPETGFTRGGPSLVLLTKTAAYYYHEDCDICAELTKCELATGKLSSVIAAHSVSCDDMTTVRSEAGAVYDACAESR
ncbi:MAG TPA: hypothetical protein VN915_00085 [Elusimicrobiota bacterium]|nr:hypothetical protein [Elusimicrobiota bacterium]